MAPHTRLGAFFLFAGTMHFLKPRPYVAIVPEALPRKREIVFASGVAELAGGAGVLVPGTRRLAGWWLIATLLAIFPANVNMAGNAGRLPAMPPPPLWGRLPPPGAPGARGWRAAPPGAPPP